MTNKSIFGLTGIDRVSFAVEELSQAVRFAEDWGLNQHGGTSDGARFFATTDHSEIEIVAADHTVPVRTPVGATSGMTGLTWSVADAASLDRIAGELQKDRRVEVDTDGTVRSHDDLGFGIAFRFTRRQPKPFSVAQFNAPGQPSRVDRRAVRYDRARPHEISHVAINVSDAAEASSFYVQRLGFIVSDRYANRGVFLRCSGKGNHHHLFLMNGRDGGVRFNHLAFKVRDIHEVIAGGQYIDSRGWTTFAGPGRHHVSSANFWYFSSPFGGSWEYAADEDIVTEAWEAQDFAAESHIFSEWTFGLEKSDGTLRGPISHSRTNP